MKEGEIAVSHMLDEQVDTIHYHNVPRCVYTQPKSLVWVIRKKMSLKEKMLKWGTFNFAGNGKALVYGEGSGFVEVIRDTDTDDLLGVTIIGPHATDLISEASTAIYMDASPIEIGEAIHPHPTMSEVIQEAALDTYGKAIHK